MHLFSQNMLLLKLQVNAVQHFVTVTTCFSLTNLVLGLEASSAVEYEVESSCDAAAVSCFAEGA